MKLLKYVFLFSIISIWFYYAWIKPYQKDPNQFKTLFQEAEERGDYERALNILKYNINKKSTFDHYYFFGKAYQNLMFFDSALFEYEKAIMIDSINIDPYIRISRINYEIEKNFQKAHEYLLKGFKIDSLNLDLLNEFGTYYYAIGKRDSSKNQFLKVLSIDDQNHIALHNLGVFYLRSNEFEMAQTYLFQSLNSSPQNSTYLSKINESIGILFFLNENFPEAKKYFLESQKINRRNENVNFHLGLICSTEDDHENAVKYFTKAISFRKDPDFKTFFNRAYSYFMLGDLENSLKDLNFVLEKEPDNGSAYGLRGNVNYLMENDINACNDFRAAVKYGQNQYYEAIKKYCI